MFGYDCECEGAWILVCTCALAGVTAEVKKSDDVISLSVHFLKQEDLYF